MRRPWQAASPAVNLLKLGAIDISPRRFAALAALVAVLPTYSTAQAQNHGVTVDPDSPSGTEYSIPIEEARRESGSDSATFGAGVKPKSDNSPPAPPAVPSEPAPSGVTGSDTTPAPEPRKKSNGAGGQESVRAKPMPEAAVGTSEILDSDDSDSSALLPFLIGVPVLLLVLGLGMLTWRRLRSSPDGTAGGLPHRT